ncbi:DnaA N-terminal domain-containing protein, partial [Pigmentiphaga sp.]|uniref:DnaA N-terminal domain-containing protein n=1 Tax=Pigmentiphaga sp. TaxID=1977564 RepID=UPI0025FB19CB
MEDFWQNCARTLEQELTPQQYSAWIRPLVPLAFDEAESVLRVAAPNRFKLDWVRSNFSGRIESLAAQWFQRPVQVKFELDSSRMAMPLRAPSSPAAGPNGGNGNGARSPGQIPPGFPGNPVATVQSAAARAARRAAAAPVCYTQLPAHETRK